MRVGSLVTFIADEMSFEESLFFLQRGFPIPTPGKTVCMVSWIGEHPWLGNKRDIRMCVKLEEYGDSCIFPLICWREASREEEEKLYFDEYEVVSSIIHT